MQTIAVKNSCNRWYTYYAHACDERNKIVRAYERNKIVHVYVERNEIVCACEICNKMLPACDDM